MAVNKNITMKQYNGTDYDTLYPQTIASQISGQIPSSQISGQIPVSKGGTGATDAKAARQNLGAVTTFILSTTLYESGWTGTTAPFTQKITLSDIQENDTVIADVYPGSISTAEEGQAIIDAWSHVSMIHIASGYITAECYSEKPAVDITIQLLVVR